MKVIKSKKTKQIKASCGRRGCIITLLPFYGIRKKVA